MLNSVPDYRHNLTTPLPMFCLVDNDPYGLNIYGVYKYGGEKLSSVERETLALPNLQYIGVGSGDFRGDEGVIALTERDRRKIEIMMQKEWVQKEVEVLYALLEK